MEAVYQPKVTLVHDWLTGMRGGEKCLESLCARWPDARLFTLLHRQGSVSPVIEQLQPKTSLLQRLPGVHRYYRYLLPLMPFAANWRIPKCDVVVSMSHAIAKAAIPPAGVPHICYCFTPMRYAWHMQEAYFGTGKLGRLKSALVDRILSAIRSWDRRTSERVSHFIAISRTIQQRIFDCYGRTSTVIFPPADTELYTPSALAREDFYLVVSAFAPYKRVDLAIDACRRLGRKLVIIGKGQEAKKLKSLAGPDVHFAGWQPDDVIRDYYRRCRALLFPGEEDFGIVPVEANACGTPVIAYGKGGATETQLPFGRTSQPTAVFFHEQQVEALIEALEIFEKQQEAFFPGAIRRQALKFNKERYERELIGFIEDVVRGAPKQTIRAAA
jgi:glycosyltransferase involved in cell wall biosynthesis